MAQSTNGAVNNFFNPIGIGKGGPDDNTFNRIVDPFNFTKWENKDPDPYGGMPQGYAQFNQLDPNSLNISGSYTGSNAPLNAYSAAATRSGPSQGTEEALQQNQIAANQGRDQANKIAAGSAANASANLAMHGGVGAGTEANLQKNAANQAAAGANAADAGAATARGNMVMQDANNKLGMQANAANMTNATNAQNYNMKAGDLSRQQGGLDRQNAYNMNYYNNQMSGWAAGKQAEATANSGKK